MNTALDEGFALAKRAVELDENESACLSVLATAHLLRRSYDLALQHMHRALQMNPNNQWSTADMGTIKLHLGQAEEALVWLQRAKEIDPYFSEPWYLRAIGEAHMNLHHYEEALRAFEDLHTRPYRVVALIAGCFARLGDGQRARAHVAECLAIKPNFSIAQYLSKLPFKNPSDEAIRAETLRMAGFPE